MHYLDIFFSSFGMPNWSTEDIRVHPVIIPELELIGTTTGYEGREGDTHLIELSTCPAT